MNWGVGEILWFRRATGDLAERMRAVAARQTGKLQDWLADAPWFGGERFGFSDAAVAPVLNRSVHYGLGPAAGNALARWHARLCGGPSVARTFAEFDEAALRMAETADLYTTGGRCGEYRDHRRDWMIRSGGLDIVRAGLRNRGIRFSWPDGEDEASPSPAA